MFTNFLYHLRAYGLTVTTTEWLVFLDALGRGYARTNVASLYHVGRAILVNSEARYDVWDRAFASFFEGVEDAFDISEELLEWLETAMLELPKRLTAEQLANLEALDLDELKRRFEERLQEQKERHDGGNHWVGTGGTSPFGQGGTHPTGVRVGAGGGGRSAAQVAAERRFRNLRSDRVLDTRQIGQALRRLRKWAHDNRDEELDVDKTIDKTARNGGEIDLVFSPPRRNKIKLLLLMDVGGSMDPWASLCERLFSAAHASNHFKKFETYFFHNCVYEQLFSDIYQRQGPMTEDVLRNVDESWSCIIVGDAYMHPYELSQSGGAIDYRHDNNVPGIEWLRRIHKRMPNSVWLNPEAPRIWGAPSIRYIRDVFPMFHLTLDGLKDAVDVLRGARSAESFRVHEERPAWAR